MSTPTFNGYATALPAAADLALLGIFNVKNYGAKGDGATDDTAAIQSAVNAANTAGGGMVWLPPGVYILGTNQVNLYTNVSLVGSGIDVTIIRRSSTSPNWAYTSLVAANNASQINCRVSDVTLDGNYTTGSGYSSSSLLKPGPHWVCERIKLMNSTGFKVTLNAVVGVRLRALEFYGYGTGDNIGDGANVSDLLIEGCYYDSAVSGNAMDLVGSSNVRFVNNTITGNSTVYLEGTTDCLVSGNYSNGSIVVQSDAGYNGTTINMPRGNTVCNNDIDLKHNGNQQGIGLNYNLNGVYTVMNTGGGNTISGNRVANASYVGILKYTTIRDGAQTAADTFTANNVRNTNIAGAGTVNFGAGVCACSGLAITVAKGDLVENNVVSDDQATHTTPSGVSISCSSGGIPLKNLYVAGNNGYNLTGSTIHFNDTASLDATTVVRGNPGYNPIGPVTVTPASHAWTNMTFSDVDVYVATAGSYTGTTTLKPNGGTAVTVPNAIVGGVYKVPAGATLTWGVGGAVTTDPTFDGFGN